jgi:hypothetical protein
VLEILVAMGVGVLMDGPCIDDAVALDSCVAAMANDAFAAVDVGRRSCWRLEC